MSDTPTPDLVERLRDPICWKSMDDMECGCCEDNRELMHAAADKIERLRDALERIGDAGWMPDTDAADYRMRWNWTTQIAERALDE